MNIVGWLMAGYATTVIIYAVAAIKDIRTRRKHIEAINRYTDTVVEQNELLKNIIGVKPKEE